eukprot:TRINITY_DN24094_c0_g1_i1.p1 TRINITY_DN24094_c0_g1~~TRINITY_DN24094_c0_g1_i1.p1  ORF type:complete len:560 (-),score=96.22 TRINITY_DN24094_c0_g1_i1:109-1767(-)
MTKRALCVGCNYPSKAFGLAGAVNDAFLIAETLQVHLGYRNENVCVLHDVYPRQKKSLKVEAAKCPTRVNILHQLQQVVRNTKAGDALFFSFSGYGLQVDDMDGFQDEGYDEAILPTDFVDGREGDYSVIITNDIHDILLGVPQNVAVTVLMDCDHATSLIDVGGTLDGSLVSGLRFSNFCGLKAHSSKMTLANHERDVWQEEKARSVKARPRFQPLMEIENPRKGRLPTRPAMSRSSSIAFCYAAAGHGQTAMEMQMTVPGVEGSGDTQKQYGVLSWCFVKALEELRFQCTYYELMEEITKQMRKIKSEFLPRMDQEVLMTFAAPLSKPRTMKALQPLDGATMVQADRGNSGMGQSMRLAGPSVVPPPPPGYIASSASTAPATALRQASEDMPPQPQANAARLPQRSTSELVHHNVEGREGGSFTVQGTSCEPAPNRYAQPPPREPSRSFSRQGELVENRQLPAPPPPRGQLPPASPGSSRQPPYSGQPGRPPAVAPVRGLTPPDLFGGAGPPSLSFSIPGYGNIDQAQAKQGQRQQSQARMPWSAPLYGR